MQIRVRAKHTEENLLHADDLLGRAVGLGAQLVLFPEMFSVGSFADADLNTLAEGDQGPTSTWLRQRAARHKIWLAGGVLTNATGRPRNSLVLAGPDGGTYIYDKRGLGPIEQVFLDRGDRPGILHTPLGVLGVTICSDLNLGETCVRPLVGAVDLLLAPLAQGSTRRQYRIVRSVERLRRSPLLAGHVRTIGSPAVTAGLIGPFSVGVEAAGNYLRGGTHVIDENGRELANVAFDKEGVAVATVSLGNNGGQADSRLLRDPAPTTSHAAGWQ